MPASLRWRGEERKEGGRARRSCSVCRRREGKGRTSCRGQLQSRRLEAGLLRCWRELLESQLRKGTTWSTRERSTTRGDSSGHEPRLSSYHLTTDASRRSGRRRRRQLALDTAPRLDLVPPLSQLTQIPLNLPHRLRQLDSTTLADTEQIRAVRYAGRGRARTLARYCRNAQAGGGRVEGVRRELAYSDRRDGTSSPPLCRLGLS